mgnify:CR=1 FL=1
MKKLFLVLAAAAMTFGAAYAQEEPEAAPAQDNATEQVVDEAVETTTTNVAASAETLEGEPMHFALMKKFLEGGWEWMLPVLLCLVFGLAIAIERILYLRTDQYQEVRRQRREAAQREGRRGCQGVLPQHARSRRFYLLSGSDALRSGLGGCREGRRILRFGSAG